MANAAQPPSQIGTASPLQRRLAWRKVAATLDDNAIKVTVLATFTANPLEGLLGHALHEQEVPARVHTGPYDQIVSQCLMPGSETDLLQPDVVVVWPRSEDVWRALPVPLVDDLQTYAEPLIELAQAAKEAANRWKATLVFVLPVQPEVRPLGVGDASNLLGVTAAWERSRMAVRESLAGTPGVVLVDAEQAVRLLGVANSLDPRTMTTARVPYTDALFSVVADDIARLVRLLRRGAKKLVVVDADNTLWGGVVGEDGADGIDLLDNGPGEAFRAFQSWLLELRRAGLVIAVASKNNEADLWEGFERREMVLRRSDLASWRVNWDPKSANIAAMVDELNLGLASVVFIDDNPLETMQVTEALSEVTVLQMPEDPSLWIREIAGSGVLDRLPPTREDLGRAESYAAESERRIVREQMTPEQYLASLGIEVTLAKPLPADLARLAQLVAKTNQFTLGGPRHDEASLAAMIDDPTLRVRLVSVVDRFGDYGVVGATICRVEKTPVVLDTFVLSCRAMGRRVEDAMLSDACSAGDGALEITLGETAKNLPGRSFFQGHGATVGSAAVVFDVGWPDHVKRKGEE